MRHPRLVDVDRAEGEPTIDKRALDGSGGGQELRLRMAVRNVHDHGGRFGHHSAVRQGEDRHLGPRIDGEKLGRVVRLGVEVDLDELVVGTDLRERGMGRERSTVG